MPTEDRVAKDLADARDADIKEMVTALTTLAAKHGLAAVGYVWGGRGDRPLFLRFSNVSETGDAFRLMLRGLGEMEEEKVRGGHVRHEPIPTSFQA